MVATGDGSPVSPRRRRRAGLLGRLCRLGRLVVTEEDPAGRPGRAGHRPAGPPTAGLPTAGLPTVGLVACHRVSGGYGDQVVALVEHALERRGHVPGRLDAVDHRAPVVLVAHAGPRSRPVLPAVGVDPAVLARRPVALVVYGPAPLPDPGPLDALRAAATSAGARVGAGVVSFDTAGLRRPTAVCRPGPLADDRFGRLALDLVLDQLLADVPHTPPIAFW